MAAAIRRAIWSVDKDQAIGDVTTLDAVRSRTVARPRLLLVLLAAFGALGLVLGALGLYGVIAYMVRQRRTEIGIRIALGAEPRRVLALVMRRGVAVTAAGITVGLAAALALARGMRAVLFEVTPVDPVTYASVAALLAVVALVAMYIPARAALRLDPVDVLRPE
jgi:ABC-type antimicrobial peptide transport system permease subunit